MALPVRRNPQHKSLLTVLSATSATPFKPLRNQGNVFHPVVNRFTQETLPNVSTKHFFELSPFAPKKHTIKRCSSSVHSSSTVAILTTKA
jgi:hypothetical protein